jgi:L-lysine exporter family protein LysE/ArgO
MSFPTMIAGLLFGLSLIVAIGAQNAFVLAQGAQRRHVAPVVAICASSDVLLVVLAVGGLAVVATKEASVMLAIHWSGALLLITYAALCARRAINPEATTLAASPATQDLPKVVLATLMFTWLNPAVYLDMLVVGSVADSHDSTRWSFATGIALGSILWFVALGYGATLLSPLLSRPRAPRYLDAFIALTMAATATRLLLS